MDASNVCETEDCPELYIRGGVDVTLPVGILIVIHR